MSADSQTVFVIVRDGEDGTRIMSRPYDRKDEAVAARLPRFAGARPDAIKPFPYRVERKPRGISASLVREWNTITEREVRMTDKTTTRRSLQRLLWHDRIARGVVARKTKPA